MSAVGCQCVNSSLLSLRNTLLAGMVLLVTACGGGGGMNNPPSQQPPPPPPPTPPPLPFDAPPIPPIDPDSPFNTTEFQTNYGLRSLNAHTAYERGVSGDGVLVAVIDDGVDIDHPDLDANISPLSVDIRTGLFADIDTQQTHGTQIAGIIAAERNGTGVHGVAYDAELLVIRALDEQASLISDVVKGIDYARENGAKILNLSITVDAIPTNLRMALDRAVDAGMLIVISAGNNLPGDDAINRLDPISLYSTFDTANGQALAVGAIDEDNNMAFFSNRPGTGGADFYLLAPGVDIVSTTVGGGLWELSPDPDPQFFGIDLDASGTSFAAPHVSGAAAVLWQMFPNLTAREVAEILLTSSVDVGDPGVDAVSGHGIMDLGAAVQPKGALTIPLGLTSFDAKSPASSSFILAGAAYGNSLSTTDAFAGALLQDRFRRAYSFDFHTFTSDATLAISLEDQLNHRSQNRFVDVRLGNSSYLNISARRNHWSELQAGGRFSYVDFRPDSIEYSDIAMSANTVLPGGGLLEFRQGYGASSMIGDSLGLSENGHLNSGTTATHMGAFVRGGASLSLQQGLSDGVNVIVGFSRGHQRNALTEKTQSNMLAELGVSVNVGTAGRFAATVGELSEKGAALGLTGTGAFSGIDQANTRFIRLGGRTHLAGWSLFGTFLTGFTHIFSTPSSLFESFSTLRSSSFSYGIQKAGFLGKGDLFSVSLSQPLRVDRGFAVIDIATAVNADDQLTRSRRRLSLAAPKHEYDLQVSYQLPIAGIVLSSEFLYRMNPGHSATASSDASLLLQLSSRF